MMFSIRSCEGCAQPFRSTKDSGSGPVRTWRRYCSKECRHANRKEAKRAFVARVKQAVLSQLREHPCGCCGKLIKDRVTCSAACRSAYMRQIQVGKPKLRSVLIHRTCDCGRVFTATQRNVLKCRPCGRRVNRGREESRAKRKGVAYQRGIRPAEVFARDGWRCQLCGIRTPKRLRGTYQPNAPEVDHIVPLSVAGSPGHVWSNVQCACRRCNMDKGNRTIGQLRLAV